MTGVQTCALRSGADADAPPAYKQGRTALQAASENGNIELVRLLIRAGADINAPPAYKQGRTALQAASKNGNIELVQLLLQVGADVNAPLTGDYGRTMQSDSWKHYTSFLLPQLPSQIYNKKY